MTPKQSRHLDSKWWLKMLKQSLLINKRAREYGMVPRLNPKRLPA